MDYEAFIDKVSAGVQEFLGETAFVQCSSVKKNNGIILRGISISQEESNLSPNIYLEEFYAEYQRGKTIGSIIYEIVEVYDKCKSQECLNMDFFTDYSQMKDRIVYKLVHADKNRDLLKEIPHVLFLDLAIVFYCMVFHEKLPEATVLIHNHHCKIWEKGARDLLAEAEKNTPRLLKYEIKSMENVMRDIFAQNLKKEFRNSVERNLEDEIQFDITEEWIDKVALQMIESIKGGQNEIPMYVLSNRTKVYGAACILYPGVLRQFAEQLDEDIFILPSSVHEVILIPARGNISNDKLADMVREVNDSQLMDEEILSDEVYLYSKRDDKIRMRSGLIDW